MLVSAQGRSSPTLSRFNILRPRSPLARRSRPNRIRCRASAARGVSKLDILRFPFGQRARAGTGALAANSVPVATPAPATRLAQGEDVSLGRTRVAGAGAVGIRLPVLTSSAAAAVPGRHTVHRNEVLARACCRAECEALHREGIRMKIRCLPPNAHEGATGCAQAAGSRDIGARGGSHGKEIGGTCRKSTDDSRKGTIGAASTALDRTPQEKRGRKRHCNRYSRKGTIGAASTALDRTPQEKRGPESAIANDQSRSPSDIGTRSRT